MLGPPKVANLPCPKTVVNLRCPPQIFIGCLNWEYTERSQLHCQLWSFQMLGWLSKGFCCKTGAKPGSSLGGCAQFCAYLLRVNGAYIIVNGAYYQEQCASMSTSFPGPTSLIWGASWGEPLELAHITHTSLSLILNTHTPSTLSGCVQTQDLVPAKWDGIPQN